MVEERVEKGIIRKASYSQGFEAGLDREGGAGTPWA